MSFLEQRTYPLTATVHMQLTIVAIFPRNAKTRTALNCIVAMLTAVLFPACLGCQVLGIPSARYSDQFCGSISPTEIDSAECSYCPLPPTPAMPGWLARWHSEKELPKAPGHPRFHRLPTHPMFANRSRSEVPDYIGEPKVSFGGIPRGIEWDQSHGGGIGQPQPIPSDILATEP